MAVQADYWMDRVRAAESNSRRLGPAAPVEPGRESPELAAARRALHFRSALPQRAPSPPWARAEAVANSRVPKRLAFAVCMLAAGLIASFAGSSLASQPLLLAGFGCALIGVLTACAMLSIWLDPRAKAPVPHETPIQEPQASAEQVAAVKRAAKADPELAGLIESWWHDGAPLRRQDVMLVLAFQKAKAVAASARSTRH